MKIFKKIDNVFFSLIFGSILPILMFLLFWWISILFVKNNKFVAIIELLGLAISIA